MTNRFKELGLIDRGPKNYGKRFITLYRRRWPKPPPRKRNVIYTNSWEKKRSERQRGKGKLSHLNAEFQRTVRRVRIVRRDKKALLKVKTIISQISAGMANLRECVLVLSCFSWVWLFVTQWSYKSLQGSSVHEILQARILEWVAMPSSRGYSQPRDQTRISYISCTAGKFLTISAWEAQSCS